jgi:hypothetical protein
MASELLKAYTTTYNHEVGNLTEWDIRVLPNGAIVTTADVDNFTLVELGFDATTKERTCKQLSANTNKAYLIASPERRYIDNEPMVNFYNAIGDRARIVILEISKRFDTSAFTLNTGVTEIVNGLVAHFDVATKKFILSTAGAAHADYATASAQFVVVDSESNLEYTLGKATIRLEVTKA